MRIAFLVGVFPKISETFILNQITGLLDRGHEIDIYAVKRGVVSVMHSDVKNYNLFDKTYFLRDTKIPLNKIERVIKGFTLFLKVFSKKPKAALRSLNFFKYGKRAFSLELLYKIFPFVGKKPYDIIQCHFGTMGSFGVLLREIGSIEGKIITTFHGGDMSIYIRKHGTNVYRYLFDKGDLFLPISEKWRQKLIEMGCDRRKIIVHRMGVDINKFKYSPGVKSKSIKLLSVGNLVEKKGLEYGIRAVAKVIKKHPDIKYNIAGDGPLRSELEHLIKELKVEDKIKILGRQLQKQVMKLMQEANIMIAPSVTSAEGDQEGIPVVLMEAMAIGLPIISTTHSGIPELVQDGKSGFLIPERDADSLKEKLLYLIEHPGIWKKMGRAGRSFVEKHYNIHKLNDTLVEIYRELIEKH